MVILQGFYWDCHKNWYKELNALVDAISNKGFKKIWLPPPSRGMNGYESMGYDIKEHYNLDSRFGGKKELKDLINKFQSKGVEVLADVVMGHMVGGDKELNLSLSDERVQVKTWTKFNEKKFPKDHRHFCHNCGCCNSDNEFGETICYYSDDGYMKDGLIKWCRWLKEDIGYNGFRIDNCKDIRWDFLKEWKKEFGCFTVGELWDGDIKYIDDFRNQTKIDTLNFPMFYKLKEMCMNPDFDMRKIYGMSYPGMVNFVSNHDIGRTENGYTKDIVKNKELAYAYIMFQNEPAVIFWKDYFDYNLKKTIDPLIKINNSEDENELNYLDSDLYVVSKNDKTLLLNNGKVERGYAGISIEPKSYKVVNKCEIV